MTKPSLSKLDLLILIDYIDEIDALIEEDDGTFFTMPLLAKHNEVKEILNAIAEG